MGELSKEESEIVQSSMSPALLSRAEVKVKSPNKPFKIMRSKEYNLCLIYTFLLGGGVGGSGGLCIGVLEGVDCSCGSSSLSDESFDLLDFLR